MTTLLPHAPGRRADPAGDACPASLRYMQEGPVISGQTSLALRGLLIGAIAASLLGACATAKAPPPPDPRETVARLEARRAPARALAPVLVDKDAVARQRAVLALARLERLDAVAGILDALDDVDAAVRATAAFAAGQTDLALDPLRPAHEARRADVESALVARLAIERDADVRRALLRALGRVATRQGLQTLVDVARDGTSTTERAVAFTALGVAGARRKASLSRDDAVVGVVHTGLRDADPAVVEGAAYAAFRQRLPLDAAAVTAGRTSSSAQARIFIARALPFVGVDAARDALVPLLRDADWRVRVETVRAVATRHDGGVEELVPLLGAAVARASTPGELHVVREACIALADVSAPAEALAAVEAAVAGLPDSAADARCTCAGAVDVLGGSGAVERCTSALPADRQQKHLIEAIVHRRVSSAEKLAALQPFVDADDARVRVAAAAAVCGLGGVQAADVAATRLVVEEDPGVAGVLLECLADEEGAVVLRDSTIASAAARFARGTTPEAVEPLLALAALARTRPGLEGLVESLKSHADARVRDVALDVPAGERAPGPRALGDAPPRSATLPLAAVLSTSRGDITLSFERELAPVAVQTFVTLARQGAYRGTPFHRVIADFVAQGGDPRGDGAGGPGFSIPCENSDAPFRRGAVGIATSGKDTGGSQFFLVHSSQPHLDGRYTLFAHVIEGLDVMDALQKDDVIVDVDVMTALKKPVR